MKDSTFLRPYQRFAVASSRSLVSSGRIEKAKPHHVSERGPAIAQVLSRSSSGISALRSTLPFKVDTSQRRRSQEEDATHQTHQSSSRFSTASPSHSEWNLDPRGGFHSPASSLPEANFSSSPFSDFNYSSTGLPNHDFARPDQSHHASSPVQPPDKADESDQEWDLVMPGPYNLSSLHPSDLNRL